ncbi:hypothetical protein [Sphingomonas sp.]|uniref:hypothetical protein n=1 Tax=Sphingomonas sp. TaxID=28214 RepID=UPI003B0010A8
MLERPLALALADALTALTDKLADLACDLGRDADTLRRHMASVQSVDLVTQSLLAIADVLRSERATCERPEAVMVEALARQLRSSYERYQAAAVA